MQLYAKCMCCMINQQERQIRKFDDEERKAAFIKEIMTLTGSCGPEYSAPWILALMTEIREKYFGKDEEMPRKKREFNQFLLDLEDELAQMIQESGDALKEAMRFARIGNYIDFSALEHVSKEEFLKLFHNEKDSIDETEYAYLLKDLEQASELVYIMDNCGEIVLDKLLIRELKKSYPNLHITAMVRGREAVNDATMEDAEMTGITGEVPVITNNSSITGVVLSELPEETREVLDKADLILAKGQGNFESLHGCGKNIYYLFLCKCELFSGRFQVEQFQGMLVSEKRVRI
ncbi:ARMT1-like domain-containing protein [Lachnospiraceae bacterium KK002]